MIKMIKNFECTKMQDSKLTNLCELLTSITINNANDYLKDSITKFIASIYNIHIIDYAPYQFKFYYKGHDYYLDSLSFKIYKR